MRSNNGSALIELVFVVTLLSITLLSLAMIAEMTLVRFFEITK